MIIKEMFSLLLKKYYVKNDKTTMLKKHNKQNIYKLKFYDPKFKIFLIYVYHTI